MLDRDGNRRFPLKGQTPGEHLIEDDPSGVNIRARVGAFASGLFGGDIVNRSERLLCQSLRCVFQTGDAKVRDFHTAVPHDHDILRLNIPVDNAPAVRVGQSAHDLNDKVQRLPPVQLPALLHILFQRDAVDQLHDKVFDFPASGHVVNGDNMGAGELRHGL